MSRLLVRKSLRESQWLLLGCSAAIFAFCWIRVWVVSRLSTDRFRAILEMLPGDWRRLLAVDFEWLITYQGRISLAYQELIVVVCVAIWSVARGSDVVSGELNRGTMEMLLAQPLSRTRVLLTQSCVAIAGVGVLSLAAWTGTVAGVYSTQVKEQVSARINLPLYVPGIGDSVPLPFAKQETQLIPMHQKVDVAVFIPASCNLFAFGVMLLGISTLMSSWDRYRWRTIGLVSATLIVQLLLELAGRALEGWGFLTYFTLLSAYEPEVHVRLADTVPGVMWTLGQYDSNGQFIGLAPLAHDFLLVLVGLICLLCSLAIFNRRDLPAPL